MSYPVKLIVSVVVVLLVQVLLLNSVVIRSSISILHVPVFIPILYPLLLITFPVNMHRSLLMALGFIIGLVMDIFSNTPGIHASACVLIAFLRPIILSLFLQQQVKEIGAVSPSIYRLGFSAFVLYAGVLILIHHFYFYLLQFWSWRSLWIILYKTILSGILTLLLVILSQLLFVKKK